MIVHASPPRAPETDRTPSYRDAQLADLLRRAPVTLDTSAGDRMAEALELEREVLN